MGSKKLDDKQKAEILAKRVIFAMMWMEAYFDKKNTRLKIKRNEMIEIAYANLIGEDTSIENKLLFSSLIVIDDDENQA